MLAFSDLGHALPVYYIYKTALGSSNYDKVKENKQVDLRLQYQLSFYYLPNTIKN